MNTTDNHDFVFQIREQIRKAPKDIDTSALEKVLEEIEKKDDELVKIWFLLDRSGSMFELASDVIGGFNQFVEEQQKKPGKAKITTIQFDGHNPLEVVTDAADIQEVKPLDSKTYFARGNTPLYDALGRMIEEADKRIENRKKDNEANEDQLLVVFTDGLENASRLFDRDSVLSMINERMENDWTFVFMGANQDSYIEGGKIGFKSGNVQNYQSTPENIKEAFSSISRASGEYRGKRRHERVSSKEDFFRGIKEAERSYDTQERN